jgi:hypothetical protein
MAVINNRDDHHGDGRGVGGTEPNNLIILMMPAAPMRLFL